MKFTLSWLKDHLDTDAGLDVIVEKLTAIGLEVEEVHDPAEDLAAFTVGYVVEAKQHPNADRLRVWHERRLCPERYHYSRYRPVPETIGNSR
jgi:phenylalanyl-tRNA synthetase beta chain